jgi:hypothetical protein
LRRVSVVVVAVLLMLTMLALAGGAALAAPPDGQGQPRATEPKDTGSPNDPNCFGTAASQVATTFPPGSFGEHASSQEEPRQGVGNVARNDGAQGTRPSDHAALVGPQMGIPCGAEPGRSGAARP